MLSAYFEPLHCEFFLVKLKCRHTSIRISNGWIRTRVWFPPSWWKVRSSTLLCPKLHRQNHSGVRNIHYISGIHFAAIYGLPQRTFRAKKCREALHDLHMPSWLAGLDKRSVQLAFTTLSYFISFTSWKEFLGVKKERHDRKQWFHIRKT